MNILYEDKDIIVCVKEPGVPVQSDKTRDKDMVNMLRNYVIDSEHGFTRDKGIPFIGLVHRLDRPVGGVMVFAKTPAALKELNRQLSSGKIDKMYLAIVEDDKSIVNIDLEYALEDKWICLEDYLLKDGRANVSKVVKEGTKDSKKATLYYRCIDKKEDMAMLEINLITGRHHQIRVQMSHHGMALVGDTKYNEKCSIGQVMLFSYKLAFIHPTTKKNMTFEYKPTHGEFKLFN